MVHLQIEHGDIYEYDENPIVPQSQSQNSSGELGDVGDSGKLRCPQGKGRHHYFMCVYIYSWLVYLHIQED